MAFNLGPAQRFDDGISFNGQIGIFYSASSPAGEIAEPGTLALYDSTPSYWGELWIKYDTANTDWGILLPRSQSAGGNNKGIFFWNSGGYAETDAYCTYDSNINELKLQDAVADAVSYNLYLKNRSGDEDGGTAVGIGFVNEAVDGDNQKKCGIVHERLASYGRGTLHILQENTADTSSADLTDSVFSISALGNIVQKGYTEFKDIATPAAPGAGLGRLYKKTSDDGLWWRPDNAAEVDLTVSGGGSNVEDGTAAGQMVFWDGASEYKHTEVTEIFWDDSSKELGVGISSPNYRLSIGSADHSKQIGLYHDNTNAHFRWDAGSLNIITDEGTNTNTNINIQGKGTGYAVLNLFDENETEILTSYASGGSGFVYVQGTSPSALSLQWDGNCPIEMFRWADEGETQKLKIYGYKTGDASRRSLEIGISSSTNDRANFSGVSEYLFDGSLIINQNATITGNLVINGDFVKQNVETLEIEDNFGIINFGESGAGVTAGYAGWEVDRGTSNPYRWGFNESNDAFELGVYYQVATGTVSNSFTLHEEVIQATSGAKGYVFAQTAGSISLKGITGTFDSSNIITGQTSGETVTSPTMSTVDNLQSVATREDSPTANGIVYWDDSNSRLGTSSLLIFNSAATTGDMVYVDASAVTSGNGWHIEVDAATMDGGFAIKVTTDTVEKFTVDEEGNVNIEAGSEYQIDGTDILKQTESLPIFIMAMEDGGAPPDDPIPYASGNYKNRIRKFTNVSNTNLLFNWPVPPHIVVADGIKFQVNYIATNAAITGKKTSFSLRGYCFGDNDLVNGTFGAKGYSNDAAITCVQHDSLTSPLSSAITTITGLTGGETAVLELERDAVGANDDEANPITPVELIIFWNEIKEKDL